MFFISIRTGLLRNFADNTITLNRTSAASSDTCHLQQSQKQWSLPKIIVQNIFCFFVSQTFTFPVSMCLFVFEYQYYCILNKYLHFFDTINSKLVLKDIKNYVFLSLFTGFTCDIYIVHLYLMI